MKRQRIFNSRRLLLAGSLLFAACNNEPKPANNGTGTDTPPPAVPVPAVIPYEIVNTYPHDKQAFTEGLEYRDGKLYEGTGQYGTSDVRIVELATGKVLLSKKIDAKYFGEGITVLNGKIYQLTYKEGKGFIYDAATLQQTGTFTFTTAEAWGMTNNGTHLIFGDGSNMLYFVDPNTFQEVKRLSVTDEYGPVKEINEPELIKGYLYANVWRTDMIIKIDTATGRVVGRTDLSSLRAQIGIPSPSGVGDDAEVLNGIAYDAANNRIYITGKYWPKLLEVKLDN